MAAPPASVHLIAATGFTSDGAALYDKGRPDYEHVHVARVLELAGVPSMTGADGRFPSKPIVELAAGTGKFTRPLVARLRELCPPGCRPNLICVEPTGFSSALADLVEAGDIQLITASADSMPTVESGSASAVIAAQALHWFSNAASFDEISRIMAPDATFIAIWNGRDRDNRLQVGGPGTPVAAWVTRHEAIVDAAYHEGTPRYQSREWEKALKGYAGFAQPPELHLWHRAGGGHVGTVEEHVAATMSISEIARRPAEEKARIETELRALLAEAPKTRRPRATVTAAAAVSASGGAAALPDPGSAAASAEDTEEVLVMPMYTEVAVVRLAKR